MGCVSFVLHIFRVEQKSGSIFHSILTGVCWPKKFRKNSIFSGRRKNPIPGAHNSAAGVCRSMCEQDRYIYAATTSCLARTNAAYGQQLVVPLSLTVPYGCNCSCPSRTELPYCYFTRTHSWCYGCPSRTPGPSWCSIAISLALTATIWEYGCFTHSHAFFGRRHLLLSSGLLFTQKIGRRQISLQNSSPKNEISNF